MAKKRYKTLAEINVVPYIDVMLVLLVIFMITAPLLQQGVQVNLPQAHTKAITQAKQTPIVVSVNAQGQQFANIAAKPQQAISATQLSQLVSHAMQKAQQKHQQQPVYVKADKSVAYGTVIRTMALLQQAGANAVGLITQGADQSK